MRKIAILGAGTWGITLAKVLAVSGHDVTVWSAIETELVLLKTQRRHPNLREMKIPDEIRFDSNLERTCKNTDIVLFAIPSVYVRTIARQVAPYVNGQIIVDVAKGIEIDTLLTMSQVIGQEVKNARAIVALSGPTHAEEVSQDIPTTIVSACEDENAAKYIQDIFSNTCMRVYTSDDVLGIEICGALKNIIALAAGISTGLGYGDNTKAALITRGMAEISRLGRAMGCKQQTFYGLAGIGDLIVTATSKHSRNYRCGQLLSTGMSTKEAIQQVGMVVEGINSLPAAIKLSERYSVEMPIISILSSVINGDITPSDAVATLMMREKKTEQELMISNERKMEMKRVITYGTFDLLHYGHINLLKRAKALGDYLVVAISTDEFNWNEKQKKCYFTYEQRKALVEAVRYVDLVIPETCWEQKKADIHEYHIDTFVMGDDWKGKFDFLKDEGVEVVYLPRTPEISTTQIKKDLNAK